jgi:hypothetical protein
MEKTFADTFYGFRAMILNTTCEVKEFVLTTVVLSLVLPVRSLPM